MVLRSSAEPLLSVDAPRLACPVGCAASPSPVAGLVPQHASQAKIRTKEHYDTEGKT